jgi:simple sugar transport system ATP-binding protein
LNNQTPVIELKNVSKTFGEVNSLSDINLAIYPGEIVGLLGDNGAGKSTLVKTIMGFHKPNEGGEIWFKGEKISDWSVAKARELGIETIYQERALCEQQPIWRNMFMGREPVTKWGLLDVHKMRSEAACGLAAVHPGEGAVNVGVGGGSDVKIRAAATP